jgi:hypothetical protein
MGSYRMRSLALATAALLLSGACRGPVHSQPTEATASSALVKLSSGGLTLRWTASEAPLRGDASRPVSLGTRAVGLHRALVGEWEVDDRRGIVGPSSGRATTVLLGLDDRDTLYGAGPTRELYRTTREERDAAMAEGRHVILPGEHATPVPMADEMRSAVVGGPVVAIPNGGTVLVSTDRGEHFRRSARLSIDSVEVVFARADGALAAIGNAGGERRVMLSPDAGGYWVRSAYEPVTIEQVGAILWNADWHCPAVLSSNGVDWVGLPEAEPTLHALRERSWGALVRASRRVRIEPAIARVTYTEPRPPAPHATAMRAPTCGIDDGGFNDASAPQGEDAAPGRQLLLPGIEGGEGFFPARLAEGMIPTPDACRAGHLVGTRGRTALVCAAGTSSEAYALEERREPAAAASPLWVEPPPPAVRFRALGSLPYPPELIADVPFPPDPQGRLVFHHRACLEDGPCRALILAPGGAVRELATAGARAYWPGPGESVVAVVTRREQSRFAVELVSIDATSAARRLVAVDGDGTLDDVGTGADGTLEVWVTREGTPRRWAVTNRGELVARL